MSEKKDEASACGNVNDSQADELAQDVKKCLEKIKHKILVFSGKGGVGKSTVSVNLASKLANSGAKVGLLDIDFHGPSVPVLLGLQGYKATHGRDGVLPYEQGNLKVMSIPFLLNGEDGAAVIWRGPMKMHTIQQLLGMVEWGELDYLIIDSPPGTGDEPLSVCQTIEDADGAIIVTTPQEVAISDVRRSVNFCEQLKLPVLGVIENMSGFVCPECGEVIDIFKSGGGEKMCQEMEVKYLGKIPLDPSVVNAGDDGNVFVEQNQDSPANDAFKQIIQKLDLN